MLTIIDTAADNLTPLAGALTKERIPFAITGDPADIPKAKALVLVGTVPLSPLLAGLRDAELFIPLRDAVAAGTPLLVTGTAVSLMADQCDGVTGKCLGLVAGAGAAIRPDSHRPQRGWMRVFRNGEHPLLAHVPDGAYFYFATTHHLVPQDSACVLATTPAPDPFTAIVVAGQTVGLAFDPAKSSDIGIRMLRNFVAWALAPTESGDGKPGKGGDASPSHDGGEHAHP